MRVKGYVMMIIGFAVILLIAAGKDAFPAPTCTAASNSCPINKICTNTTACGTCTCSRRPGDVYGWCVPLREN